jgi:hypothetical protein
MGDEHIPESWLGAFAMFHKPNSMQQERAKAAKKT